MCGNLGQIQQKIVLKRCNILLYHIYTFVRVARRMTSVPITYSPRYSLHYSPHHSLCYLPHHSLRYSPRHLWRSYSKWFFEHESKGTNGDLRYVYENVNVCTHVKTHHSHRDRGIRMFVQVVKRGTSTNV